jgi:hypothetical protein
MQAVGPDPADTAGFERRQQRLLVLAWVVTLLPLVAFGYLTWESVVLKQQLERDRAALVTTQSELDALKSRKGRAEIELDAKEKELAQAQQRKSDLEAALAKLEQEVELQRTSVTRYRNLAGIRIQFYRESDREVVEKALKNLGFNIEAKLGASKLIDRKPNTIGYGTDIAEGDLRQIASALVKAEFPLKRIAEAQKQHDPKLIQIYASAESDAKCGLLRVEEIAAGLKCGPQRRE